MGAEAGSSIKLFNTSDVMATPIGGLRPERNG